MANEYWQKRRIEELEQENKNTVSPYYNNEPFEAENTKEEILHKIKELRIARSVIFESAKDKAKAISEYEKKVSITEIKLKNGLIDKFDGVKIGKVTASAARKIAEGYCWRELQNKVEKEGLYKANLTNIESIKAELNGLQSINRHLE
jgi:hypothetical protein